MWNVKCTAYIPHEREPIHINVSDWFRPQIQPFYIAYINMLVSKKPRGLNKIHHEPKTTQRKTQCKLPEYGLINLLFSK